MAYPLALIQDNKLRTITNKSLTNEDEMSWNFLRKVPILYSGAGVNWTTSQTSGTNLITNQMSPCSLLVPGSTTWGGHSATWVTGNPLAILSSQFMFWRGSFDVTFKFIKTMYHTGTIQICWTPNYNAGTVPTVTSSVFSLREVVDIRYQSEITLNLPYMIYIPYLNANTTPQYSGTLTVDVVNELRCPENASSTIQILCYVSGGDDLELAAPGGAGIYGAPFSPQMNTETIVNSGIAESARKTDDLEIPSTCIGEHFTSLKQFLNRFSQVYLASSLPSTSNSSVIVWPWLNGVVSLNHTTGALVNPNAGGDAYNWICNAYAFYRGGARISISQTNTQAPQPIDMSLFNYARSDAVIDAGLNTRGTHSTYDWATSSPANVDGAMSVFSGITETEYGDGTAYCRVPYYCKTPCSIMVRQTVSNVYPSTEVSQPQSRVNFYSESAGFSDYAIFRSFTDDFQLSFFIGMPPYLTGWS